MQLKKYFWQLLLLAVAPVFCLPLQIRGEQLPLKLYSSADGLPTSAVFHIYRDTRGFLWFSTRAGLSRFDGHEFVNFLLEGSEDSPITYYTAETRDGSFWIAANSGLYRVPPDGRADPAVVDKKTDKPAGFQILKAEKAASLSLQKLFVDSRGRLWGGAQDLYLLAEDGEIKAQKYDLGAIASTERGMGVVGFEETADGSLWFGCENGVMRLLPDNRRLLYPIRRQTSYDATNEIAEDADGRIWVGHSTGAFVFKPETIVALDGVPDQNIRDLPLEEKIITDSGEAALPNETGKMLRLMFTRDRHKLSDISRDRQTLNIERLFRSFDGKIWVPAGGSFFAFEGQRVQRRLSGRRFDDRGRCGAKYLDRHAGRRGAV
jgi:ligand-binding sensor domain-containing protein